MKGFVIKHPKSGREFFVSEDYKTDNHFHGITRPDPKRRKYLVVHHTAGNTAGDLAVLRGKTGIEVSVKYLVADPQDGKYRDGKKRLIIYKLLRNDVIGWSVGATSGPYGYVTNANSDSIEVSNRGDGKDPFEPEQIEAVEALVAYEERRLGQELTVFAHKEIAPRRKYDTHKSFPLARIKAWALKLRKGR
jgi:N-acetyl-anhydromuramyl-L-alanine amidase AmpD